jgi:acetylornithine deacetylase/succinyl-diaminopimelate desuccinylase-like protein
VEGGVHGPDEYVEIVRLLECLKTVVYFVTQWCGVA